MAADDGDITLRDLYNGMEGLRKDLSYQIGELAKEFRGNVCTQKTECDGKMDAHDKELASHSTRIARLEYIVWGVVAVSVVGLALWFSHLAGVVPGIMP